jgi:HEAT repeat protein
VTYIKPESNQSLVKAILEQVLKAAQQQNWLEVSDRLKLLLQGELNSSGKHLLLDPEDWQTVFNIALEMLIKADFVDKWEITKLFPLLGDRVVAPLNALALDVTVTAEVRWFICQILGNFPEQSVVLTLVQLLQQSSDNELITIAGKSLIEIGDRAVDALVDLLSQPKYCLLAAKSLSYIRSVATINPLLTITTHEDAELRAIAINALGSFHDRRIPPVLITALQDRASIVRKEAAIALGFRPDLCQEMNLVKRLQPLLYDLNLEVCSQAAISLSRMQQSSATTALFEVLQADTTPIDLKSDLVKALGWSQLSSGIAYLEQALTNSSGIIMQEIIIVLGRTSTLELKSQSVQVLIDFWQRQQSLPPAFVRQTLATSLSELGDRAAQPILEELAADSDRKVQLHALSALKQLAVSNEQ